MQTLPETSRILGDRKGGGGMESRGGRKLSCLYSSRRTTLLVSVAFRWANIYLRLSLLLSSFLFTGYYTPQIWFLSSSQKLLYFEDRTACWITCRKQCVPYLYQIIINEYICMLNNFHLIWVHILLYKEVSFFVCSEGSW